MTDESHSDTIMVVVPYRLKTAEEAIKEHGEEIKNLHEELHQLRRTLDAKDRKVLLWGISTLGSFVVLLTGLLYRGELFK